MQHIVMLPTLDDIFQVDLAVLILQVQTPARNLVDIGPVDRLLITDDPMQPRFGKLACPVTLVVLKFRRKASLSSSVGRRFAAS